MYFRALSSTIFSKTSLLLATILCSAIPGLAQGAGSWHTNGNQILDSNGARVRIAGINWYGFETTDEVVHGLWAQDYHAILNAIKSNGYNTIRLPYSNQMVETPIVPSNISFANGSGPINSDLKGLNSLQVMDRIITAAGNDGLRVILVNHRSEAGNSAEANGLWYTSAYPESAWINDWLTQLGAALARHVAKEEVAVVPGLGVMLLPAPKGFHRADTYRLNASYVPLQLLLRLSHLLPDGPWEQIADSAPTFDNQKRAPRLCHGLD